MRIIFYFLCIFIMSGCVANPIKTSVESDVCISPYQTYLYKTCGPLRFKIQDELFTVPQGFKTNLASIPRILWPLLSPSHSDLMAPSIVHDWFYTTHYFDRRKSDLIFYSMLLENGSSKPRAYSMYYAVRLFGLKAYKS